MSENNFSPEQIEKNRRGQEILEMRLREQQEKLKKKIEEAPLIGKELFNLDELKNTGATVIRVPLRKRKLPTL